MGLEITDSGKKDARKYECSRFEGCYRQEGAKG